MGGICTVQTRQGVSQPLISRKCQSYHGKTQRITWGCGGLSFDLIFIESNGKATMRMLHKTLMPVFKMKNWNGKRRG